MSWFSQLVRELRLVCASDVTRFIREYERYTKTVILSFLPVFYFLK